MTALMFYGCALIFHFFLPNSSLGDPSGGSSSSSSSSSYLPHLTGDLLPIIAGIAIGLLQIPAVLMTGETLGMSGSLVSIITPLAWIPYKLGLVSDAVVLGRFHPAVIEAKRMRVLIMMEVDNTRDPRSGLNKKRQSIFSSSAESNSTRGAADRAFWFKVLLRAMQKSIYLGSIMLGAYFGSLLYIRNPILRIGTSPVSVSSILVLTPFSLGHLPLEVQSFIGGVLLFFGAKMAGGCTSSHGISGMGTLGLKSFFAVGGIFAGGCCLIFILGNGFNLVH